MMKFNRDFVGRLEILNSAIDQIVFDDIKHK